MKRLGQDDAVSLRSRDIAFQPALTPMEAAMLPALPPHRYGALAHVRASFAPGRPAQRAAARMPKLRGWGPQRTKI